MDPTGLWDGLMGDPWVRHEAFIDGHSRAFEAATFARLGSLVGAVVLDAGCGTGLTAMRLAEAGAASVVGVDLSETMINCAGDRLTADLVDQVSFQLADVTSFDPGEVAFDVIFSRFGLMFFDNPVAAFSALRRLTHPGARLGFCAWTDPFANPWMSVPIMASIAVLGPPELPGPEEPGPFSLGTEDRVRSVLERSGWSSVAVSTESLTGHAFTTNAAQTAKVVVETNPVLRRGLEAAPEKSHDLQAAITEALTGYEIDGTVRMDAAALVVTATA